MAKVKILSDQEDQDILGAFFNMFSSQALRSMARSLLDNYVLASYSLVEYNNDKNNDVRLSLEWITQAHFRTTGYVGLQDAYHSGDLPWMEYVQKMQEALFDVLPEYYGHLEDDIHKIVRYFTFDLLEQFYLFYVYDVDKEQKDAIPHIPDLEEMPKTYEDQKDDLAQIIHDISLTTLCRIGIDMALQEFLEFHSVERVDILLRRIFRRYERIVCDNLPPFLAEWRKIYLTDTQTQSAVIELMQQYISHTKNLAGITREQIEQLRCCTSGNNKEQQSLWVFLYSMLYTLNIQIHNERLKGSQANR